MAQAFNPTPEIIRVAEALMMAMAFEATIRPVVEQYEQKILEKHQWHIDKKWTEEFDMPDEIVLDRKKSYLMSSADSAVFYEECKVARDAAGLKTQHPDACPLLEAQHLRIQAENALLQLMGTLPGLERFATAGQRSLEIRQEAIELSLRFAAPFVGTASTILPRLLNAA